MYYQYILVIKLKNKYLKFLIIIILIIYISSYYVANSGFYEYHKQIETVIINEKIKEFENDIKEGNIIDNKKYLESPIDYTNRISNTLYNISNNGTKITRKLIKYLFKKVSYLMEDD